MYNSRAGSLHLAGRPAGSAGVKELYDAAGTSIIGYAVYLKTQATSKAGATWYWYEISGGGVVADGLGNSGRPLNVCVSCHKGASNSDRHPGASDYVFTPVK